MRRPKIFSAAAPRERTIGDNRCLGQIGSEKAGGAESGHNAATKGPDGASDLSGHLAVLPTLSLGDLRLQWRRLFRADPPRLSRDMMMRAVAYRLQEIVHGGVSRAPQRRLVTLAAEFETGGKIAPSPAPKIKPGSRLVREWHGRTHTVCVTDDGFDFQGRSYRSLTKIAREITGAQWSGPRFFGLAKRSATTGSTSENLLTDAEMVSEPSNG